jgi:hypothetical protein
VTNRPKTDWISGRRGELLLFIAVAILGISGALGSSDTVIGDGVDMYGTIWFYWYAKQTLFSLSDPSFTDLFFFPLGKDIFAHTGNNLVDAWASIPFQLTFPRFSWVKWWVVFLMVLNAVTFRWFASKVFHSRNAILFAAVAWELNPFTLFEITCGRFTQAFLPFLPLALGAFLMISNDRRWRWPIIAGIAAALQAWTYWFMGFFMLPALLWISIFELRNSPQRLVLIKRYALAGLVCVLIVAPGVWMMADAASLGLVPGLVGAEAGGGVEPLRLANNVSQTLHGYGGFSQLGPPMFTYIAWAVPLLLWFYVGGGRLRWLPIFIFVLAFSLGPVSPMPFSEDPVAMPHYMFAYQNIPFFDRLWFPYRMIVIGFAVGSLAFGYLIVKIERRWGLTRRAFAIILITWIALTTLEQNRFAIFPFVTKDLSPPASMIWLAEESDGVDAVVHLPFGVTQPSIVWQTIHGQPLYGGMGENAAVLWPEGFRERMRNSFMLSLLRATRNPDLEPRSPTYNPYQRNLMESEGFRWVVLHRDLLEMEFEKHLSPHEEGAARSNADLALERLAVLLGPAVATDGPLVIWDLSGEAEATEAIRPVSGWQEEHRWPGFMLNEYERALGAAGRIDEPFDRER